MTGENFFIEPSSDVSVTYVKAKINLVFTRIDKEMTNGAVLTIIIFLLLC